VSAIVWLGVGSGGAVGVGESVGVPDGELVDVLSEDAVLLSPPIEKTHPASEEHPTPIEDKTLLRFINKQW
jgi:hypothetical protein